jgi:adenine-specific DNA-methyltransferase
LGDDSVYPKSLFNVVDCVDLATQNEQESLVLDYFAGSGTTGHAVMKLNAEDDGRRRFILVEMGAYFDDVLLERIRRVMYSFAWKDGAPAMDEAGGYQGLVRYQRIEQYEDVLNRLQPEVEARPEGEAGAVPLRYLFRPEEQTVRQTLDLARPFANTATYGKTNETATLDLLATYCYLRGYRVKQQRRFDRNGRVYRAVQSGRHLVVFRRIDAGEDDAEHLLAVKDAFDGVEVLEVNHDADRRRLDEAGLTVRVVTADAFDAGTTWSA